MKIIWNGGMKMRYVNYKKHPRIYKKNLTETPEKILNLNVGTALGIIAFTFINGMGIGYMLKKKLS